jgi:hypothetical protein
MLWLAGTITLALLASASDTKLGAFLTAFWIPELLFKATTHALDAIITIG